MAEDETGFERAAPVRTLVQKVSSGHFLARGRIHGFSAASRRFVDGNPSSDTVYEKPPVQKLVASLLFAKGEKAIQALIRYPQQAEKLEFGNLYCATTKLSLRTSDRCHWCGNPFSFLAILSLECVMGCGLPRQCAHWLAMTYGYFSAPNSNFRNSLWSRGPKDVG